MLHTVCVSSSILDGYTQTSFEVLLPATEYSEMRSDNTKINSRILSLHNGSDFFKGRLRGPHLRFPIIFAPPPTVMGW